MSADHKTHANIFWMKDSIPVFLKNLAGLAAEAYVQKHGSLANWGSCHNENRLAEELGFLVEGSEDYFNEHSNHQGSANRRSSVFGQALKGRGWNCVMKQELRPFRENRLWHPMVELSESAFRTQTPIDAHQRYSVHERQILAHPLARQPGVYLNQSPEKPEIFYLGESQVVKGRNKGHRNGPLMLVRLYSTVTKSVAYDLQMALHRKIEESGLVKWTRIPEGPTGGKGAYCLADGCDPVLLVDELVKTHYREFCRATVGMDLALPSQEVA